MLVRILLFMQCLIWLFVHVKGLQSFKEMKVIVSVTLWGLSPFWYVFSIFIWAYKL